MDSLAALVAEAEALDKSMASTCEAYRVARDVEGYGQARAHHRGKMADMFPRLLAALRPSPPPPETVEGEIVAIGLTHASVWVGGRHNVCHSIHLSALPGAAVGQRTIVSVRLAGDPTEGG